MALYVAEGAALFAVSQNKANAVSLTQASLTVGFGLPLDPARISWWPLYAVAIPLLVSLAVSSVQLALSLRLGRLRSFGLALGYLAAAIFVEHPLAAGSAAMPLRTALCRPGGAFPVWLLWALLMAMGAAFWWGEHFIRQKDFV